MNEIKNKEIKIFQKKGKETRRYMISEDGLETEITTKGQSQAFTIRFEDIEFNEMVVSKKPGLVEVGLFISVLVNLLLIVFFLYEKIPAVDETALSGMAIGIISGLSVWSVRVFRGEKEKILKGPQNLFFFYGRKDKDNVDQFINDLKSFQRKFMRKKYMKIDDLIPEENQQQTFYWLYNRNFITRTELEVLFEELDNRKIIRGR
jgi:hypothetical protein